MKKSLVVLVGLIVFSLLTACGETSYEPVDLSRNTEQCYTCHMGVEDPEFATQVILEDGTPRIFDDIGCMLAYFRETNDEIAVSYVNDHLSGEWIEFDEASFVHDEQIQTPMSYGFIAFSSEQSVHDYLEANVHGEMLTADELKRIDAAALEDWYREHEVGHDDHGGSEEEEE